jgi:CubicO group peptidase (beta-lactamase class C family)
MERNEPMQEDEFVVAVQGYADPNFERVVDAFAAGIEDPHHSGAALSVWYEGAEVVSVHAGTAHSAEAESWDDDTLAVLFSASKGLTAIVFAQLESAGEVDLNAPIELVWPEFGAHGKGTVSIADVLAHRGGVSAPRDDLPLDLVLDSQAFAEYLAQQKPLWEPGSGHAYHAITYGTIAQELIRRITGHELGELFNIRVAAPLGADATLHATAEDVKRTAHIITTTAWQTAVTGGNPEDDAWMGRALSLGKAFPRALVSGDEGFNDPRVLMAGVAGAGGVGTASALGKIWSATVTETDGVRLLNDEAVKHLRRERSAGPWVFDPKPPYHRWGAGVQLSSAITPWFSPDSFGHDGAGGQSGIADPGLGVALGYVTNRMDVEDRVLPLVAEILRSIKHRPAHNEPQQRLS